MTEYSTHSLSITNISVESITVYVEQDAVIGAQLGIHADPDQCNFDIEAIQHQIKTESQIKATLRSDLGVFEGNLIGLKRLRGMYMEDAVIPVFLMDITLKSCLSTDTAKTIIASNFDPNTLALEIPRCMFRVESW